ncbi:MAG: hypothetical protein R3C25_01325 [Hyphomonadaceae bacterium]
MRWFFVAFAALAAACTTAGAPQATRGTDFDRVLGGGWHGVLTYRDYSPPYGDVSLPVEAALTQAEGGVIIALHYPSEPHADSTELLALSADGGAIDGHPIVSRVEQGETVVLTARGPCEDDERAAICEMTYTLGDATLAWRKVVIVDGEAPLRRHEYALNRD